MIEARAIADAKIAALQAAQDELEQSNVGATAAVRRALIEKDAQLVAQEAIVRDHLARQQEEEDAEVRRAAEDALSMAAAAALQDHAAMLHRMGYGTAATTGTTCVAVKQI